jgi:hypothetical protein
VRRLLFVAASSVALVMSTSAPLHGQDTRSATVGMPARIEQIVLPGPELEVKPLDDRRQPVVLRIAQVYPHGTAFRYDLVYYGLQPGDYDLRDYLRHKDRSAVGNLPPLRVKIQSVLGPGQILPADLKMSPSPALGGYRIVLMALGVAWVLGIAVILLVRRRKQAELKISARPLTLADQLRPLVERAAAGELTLSERAWLERILLAYWRKRLQVENARPAEAFAVMRAHAEAGPLLEQLESWLHRADAGESVDVAALLRPYRDAPPEEPPTEVYPKRDRQMNAGVKV